MGTRRSNNSSDKRFIGAVIGLVVLLAVSIGAVIILALFVRGTPAPTHLTLIIVFGVTAMLASLALTSLVLNILELSNPNESLGLPAGSVRAIIALSLILIFAILAIFMFQYLDNPVVTQTITNVIFDNSTTGNSTFSNTTTITYGTSEAMVDFSKQTLTTISTLVVALAAFYFGTRAVQVAKGEKELADLFIDPSEEIEWEKGKPLTIVVKPTPEDEVVTWEIDKKDERKFVEVESPSRFIYTPSVEGTVTMTFKMPKYDDVSPKKLKITIPSPPAGGQPAGGQPAGGQPAGKKAEGGAKTKKEK